MEINTFAGKVRDAVEKKLGGTYKVEIKEVQKNNGVILHGLLILADGRNVVPTLYLEPFWAAYESGATLAEIVRRLIRIYREDLPAVNVDMDFFRYFEKVSERICYRLVRQAGNEELLQDIPHIPFLDLAVCFFYAYRGEALGEGAILIRNSHMELWHASVKELLALAQKNTPLLFPWKCSSMEKVLREMMKEGTYLAEAPDEGESGGFFEGIPLWVLSNEQRAQGASCMLYPGLLKQLAEKEKKSFYILPSSIHEVILLTDRGMETPGQLKEMIAEVNRTQVAPEEVLSDSLYYYDLQNENVRIVF
ncbi:MAG: DUF5688 family protein [Eubacterium sp.]|nr:DUF5688 family protein [Eubacterium sp.]MCM1217852.1 DUF5688 family protein [Lachnospiraceae bacterium]MCM1304648.1 DUF5688 family protein [Butyrivibrio sp.]MCM1344484.1 DUF5688 family protein [Muribaculaceae bacterium]MCM1240917.1 DUF5688 family protein [Lachnospiraceae bacterium]